MQAASGRYLLAAAALTATSAVVAIPLASRPSQLPIRSIETRLVDADSVLNIPVNLFDDIVNIPYNEVQELDTAAGSLFDTGTWWVPSSTNVWGIDPGDTTHVASVFGVLPFPALTEGNGGLDYQFDGLLAAELPASASCDAATCAPILPPNVVTGTASFDRDIAFLETVSGHQPFGLFDNWFKVPLSDLFSGYTFNSSDDPGVIDPSGPAPQGFGFPLDGGSNPFEGGTHLVDGQNAMPWDGLTYHLNLFQPFANFYNSLLATPATNGIGGTGIELPTLTEFTQALQNVEAGLVIDFDPFTAGSPACLASCDIPASMQIPALVQDIENIDPSNTTIQTWLTDYANGTGDNPTPAQVDESIALLQTGTYNMSPTELAQVDQALANINPELPALYTNAGILTDPGYVAYADSYKDGITTASTFDPVYGGYNPNLEFNDFLTLLQDAGNNPVDPTLSTDLNTVLTDFAFPGDPSALAALFGDSAASSAASAMDPTALSADLSAIFGNFGASMAPDLANILTSLF